MILAIIIIYFALLLLFGRMASEKAGNDAFFRAERKSRWYMVAFGMVGASISGVTFISVPGMVMTQQMTYLQMCMGFILGYFAVAYILLPLYYRLNLTSIYTYLGKRLGTRSYKTGAWFFLISKLSGSAIKFYVVCMLLQHFVLAEYGIPFWATAAGLTAMIWLYTCRGGIKTLVWTDMMQTACMLLSAGLIIVAVTERMDMSFPELWQAIWNDSHSRIFVLDDFGSTQNFWKQFLSGIFTVIVMTGLDQDVMQKNLTCKSLRDARKDMCSYGFAFLPVNAMFLFLGVLLLLLCRQQGMALPEKGDELLPMFAATGELGVWAAVLFFIGIVSTSFSTADSALTSLTTSFCVDIRGNTTDEKLRKRVHMSVSVIFALAVILFDGIGSSSVINLVYTVVGYTYGPLLGLFSFGLFTKYEVKDRPVPYVCVIAPVLCFIINKIVHNLLGYQFGYELLMLNGLLTFSGLLLLRKGRQTA
ncbi:MAG: sodium:solute symporter [Bacteroidales bacterium]|nr:sodium:solute symporter [Bacteroidales bacterium]MCM1147764.1 sodium:solute symporter [Bacteroidales bacterium]MCM1206626.1 sodium:solute symporter [Bacillota bacterium]MCM1510633.1 sodium:solute symporter [Clostridium sp.]